MRKKNHLNNLFSLKGKNIVILGGAGKLGISFGETLYNAGANVILGDINKKKNKFAKFEYCDVTNEKSINNFFDKLFKIQKKIHSLIYNVYSKPNNYYKKFEDYETQTWRKVIDTNLTGAYLASSKLIKHFKKKKIKGNIIFLSSTYGLVGPNLDIYKGLVKKNLYGGNFSLTTPAVYSTTKSGLLGLSKYIATTCGKYNIRSNILSPGGVLDSQEKKFVMNYSKKVPLGRMASWKDYNGAIVYLCSDASSYMTGSNLIVDGGWTAW